MSGISIVSGEFFHSYCGTQCRHIHLQDVINIRGMSHDNNPVIEVVKFEAAMDAINIRGMSHVNRIIIRASYSMINPES